MALKRREPSLGANGEPGCFISECDVSKRFPNLFEFLTRTKWEHDGKLRTPGTFLLCLDSGALKAWLNDKDAKLSAWVTGNSLEELLDRCERVLGGDPYEWRPPRPAGGRPRN